MNITIHRGTNEIGGNCVEVSTDKARLIFDIGMPLSGRDGTRFDERVTRGKSASQLVREGILPEVAGFYAGTKTQRPVDAVYISHPHGDHFGFLKYVDPRVPVCLGETTAALLADRKLHLGDRQRIIADGVPVTFADITVTPRVMDHSSCEAYAFEIAAGGKRVIYTGDFRRHGTKGKLFERFLRTVEKSPDLLITEGTNLGRGGDCKSEMELRGELAGLCRETKGAVLVAVSSENIDRLCSLYSAALKAKRTLVVDLHTALKLSLVHRYHNRVPDPSSGKFRNLMVYYPADITKRKVRELGLDATVFKYQRVHLKREDLVKRKDVVMTVHASMKRDLAAVLRYNDAQWLRDSTLIYSLWDGYLQDAKTKTFVDYLQRQGTVLRQCHTSGHADTATLRELVQTLQPKRVVPIHTTRPDDYELFGVPVRRLRDGQVMKV